MAMASSLQPHPACNAPTGMTKGKLSMTELQRQALGNMANKRTTNTQLDTKKTSKPRDDVKPAPTTRNVSILSRRTALNAPKAGMKISQLTKAQKAIKPPNKTKTTTQQPTTEPLIDTTKNVLQYQAIDTENNGQKRARTVTPEPIEPIDVTEMAGEIQRRLKLVDDVNTADMDDPYACSLYVEDIYSYLHELERRLHPDPDYMSRQPKINPRMRAILIDWLVLVHMKFNLMQETFYLTVNIIDRFLEVFPTCKGQLQLVGVTAMFLAAKYEEIYFPEIADFVYITDNSYTSELIRQMERIILKSLNYNLGSPGAIQFLRRYSKLSKASIQAHMMAKYFMEVCLMDYALLRYLPSQIAAASLSLSMDLLDLGEWSPTPAQNSNYSVADLQPIKRDIAKTILTLPLIRQQAIREKYSCQRFLKTAKHTALASSVLKTIADTSQ